MNNKDNSLFPVNMILEKGTIYPELYVPYKNYEFKLKTNNDKVELMRYTLAYHDLKLYLDLYPNDMDVKKMCEYYKKKMCELKEKLEDRNYV